MTRRKTTTFKSEGEDKNDSSLVREKCEGLEFSKSCCSSASDSNLTKIKEESREEDIETDRGFHALVMNNILRDLDVNANCGNTKNGKLSFKNHFVNISTQNEDKFSYE